MTTQLDRIESMLTELLARIPEKRSAAVLPARAPAEYSDQFLDWWEDYPKRSGANPKNKAWIQWQARAKEGLMVAMMDGLFRYSKYIEIEGIEPRYVMMAATFLGRDKLFLEAYKINRAAAQKNQMPKRDEDLAAFAVKMKLHQPGCAPQNLRNNHDYRNWIQERL